MKDFLKSGKWKNAVLIMICVILAGGIFFYNIIGGAGRRGNDRGEETEQNGNEETDKGVPEQFTFHEEKEGITQAEACRLLSYLHYTEKEQKELTMADELAGMLAEVPEAVQINAAVSAGYVKAEEIAPEHELTCGEQRDFLVNVCRAEELDYYALIAAIPERLKTVKEEDKLYLGEFLTIYEAICKAVAEKKAEEGAYPRFSTVYVLSVGENNVMYDENSTKYKYDGCEDYSSALADMLLPREDPVGRQAKDSTQGLQGMEQYQDRTIEICRAGARILYVRGSVPQEKVIPNVWVIRAENTELSVFVNGQSREYRTEYPLQSGFEQGICDLTIQNGIIRGITCKNDIIQGKVLMTTDDMIEVEGYGRLEFAEQYRIYKIYGELAMEKTNRILVGYTITDFVVENGRICAALITEKLKADNIRVLIRTTGYKSMYHDKIEITADREFTVTKGEKQSSYAKGETVSFTAAELAGTEERILLNTVGGEGKLQVLSVSRSCGNPAYRGSLEIVADKNGLLLINELSMEEYLYAVIPSEMPTSYGDEALKVQAVCARSYAFNQLVASRYRSYGAHVDDSVSCQVYNNIAENAASILAVKETYGLVAAAGGSVITAYYFSSSCGHTASYEEVWENAAPLTYLTGYLQNEEKAEPDFSDEKAFREFICSTDVETYDSGFSWYRWEVTFPAEQIKAQLCEATGLKRVDHVEVSERGKSGIILKVLVSGWKEEKGSLKEAQAEIVYQTAIRAAFAPKETDVIRMDGSAVSRMTTLPSAFFVLDEIRENGALTAIKLTGGGYGHGTGMSQNGVKGLVDAGKDFEEIIQHYYTGTELIFLY